MDWRILLIIGLAVVGAALGATMKERRWQLFGRTFSSHTPAARALAGLEGALQGVILSVCVFAITNFW